MLNRVPEKVPKKIPEGSGEGSGGCEAEPGYIQ